MQVWRERAAIGRTLIAIRKSGIRSQNIKRGVDTEYQESKGSEGGMDRSRREKEED